MESLYLVAIAIGGSLIIGQFLLSSIGLFDDVEVDDFSDAEFTDVDFEGGYDSTDHAAAGGWFVGILSFKSIFSAMAVFGMVGMGTTKLLPDKPQIALIISLAAGLGVLYIVGWTIRSIYRLQSSGTVNMKQVIGHKGSVYLTIPAQNSGTGKVSVIAQDRNMEYQAMTNGEELKSGTPVQILAIHAPGVLEVVPVDSDDNEEV